MKTEFPMIYIQWDDSEGIPVEDGNVWIDRSEIDRWIKDEKRSIIDTCGFLYGESETYIYIASSITSNQMDTGATRIPKSAITKGPIHLSKKPVRKKRVTTTNINPGTSDSNSSNKK